MDGKNEEIYNTGNTEYAKKKYNSFLMGDKTQKDIAYKDLNELKITWINANNYIYLYLRQFSNSRAEFSPWGQKSAKNGDIVITNNIDAKPPKRRHRRD